MAVSGFSDIAETSVPYPRASAPELRRDCPRKSASASNLSTTRRAATLQPAEAAAHAAWNTISSRTSAASRAHPSAAPTAAPEARPVMAAPMLKSIGVCSARAPVSARASSAANAGSGVRNTAVETSGETSGVSGLVSASATSSMNPRPSALVGVMCATTRRFASPAAADKSSSGMYVPPH